MYGKPAAIWVQVCIAGGPSVTFDEVKAMIANARAKAKPGAKIYISGQPLYEAGWTCDIAKPGGPELTDRMAQMAAADASLKVTYVGPFGRLGMGTTRDSCHANPQGQELLGKQALAWFK